MTNKLDLAICMDSSESFTRPKHSKELDVYIATVHDGWHREKDVCSMCRKGFQDRTRRMEEVPESIELDLIQDREKAKLVLRHLLIERGDFFGQETTRAHQLFDVQYGEIWSLGCARVWNLGDVFDESTHRFAREPNELRILITSNDKVRRCISKCLEKILHSIQTH